MFQINIRPSTSESCTDFLLSSSRTPRTVKVNTLQVANAREYNHYEGVHEIKFLYNQNTPTKELLHPELDSIFFMRFHYLDALLWVNGSHIDHSKALEFNQDTCRAKKWREEEGGYSSKPQRSPYFITDNKEAKTYPFPKSHPRGARSPHLPKRPPAEHWPDCSGNGDRHLPSQSHGWAPSSQNTVQPFYPRSKETVIWP